MELDILTTSSEEISWVCYLISSLLSISFTTLAFSSANSTSRLTFSAEESTLLFSNSSILALSSAFPTSRLLLSSTACLRSSAILALSSTFSDSISANFLLRSGISAFLSLSSSFSTLISATFFLSSPISAKSLAFNSLNESLN